ncbi:sigma-70 family RNA polymerase sigma factor [Moraxella nasicaprae]|uniref:Sigma-70 family RNA polymerase sigma factor n=1 Tax=Moraxella nasicaprae TaxID=2904122 RepID=A0ABY6F647_9GAMM|nr:sigma-70 family RNA polymerase sigma factor [Moraxella nasicaprae]UXZ05572.1 sigma-70 family RNA polymerase sigma factor [Moraxella nasicaprae]
MNDDYQQFIALLLKECPKNKNGDGHHSIGDVYLANLYEQLLKFAKNQLDDDELAKDCVQECLISAMQYSNKFKGNSAFKTWVFAILKHKIADMIKSNQIYIKLSELSDNDDIELFDMVFDNGKWQGDYTPKAFDESWCNPEIQAQNKAFWQILEYCLEHLPAEQAKVFLMKEYVGLDSKEICQALTISSQNYYVLMHRARLNLQTCLTRHWFVE